MVSLSVSQFHDGEIAVAQVHPERTLILSVATNMHHGSSQQVSGYLEAVQQGDGIWDLDFRLLLLELCRGRGGPEKQHTNRET